MSTPSGPLEEFFTQFDFIGYTYDPDTPPLEEFERLCQARQWGAQKIRKHRAALLLAAEREDLSESPAGPNVIKFFREYEYQLFTYDFDAPTRSEFQRLVELRGWGERNLSKVTSQFNKAVALDAGEQSVVPSASSDMQEVDHLADWLRKQECPGYRYRGDSPELEFKRLVDVKRREWIRINGNPRLWKRSSEFELLRIKFYRVVEKVFNLLMDKFCQITGLTPWQVLVGLYGNGQQGVDWRAARAILQKVYINIFDFLDAFQEILKNPPTANRRKLLRLLKPSAIELKFPSNMMLGVYSALTNRIFPLRIAKADGTLVLLLRPIKEYLESFEEVMDKFEREAGGELQAAKDEGRVGVRRLLLSREWASLRTLNSG